MWLCSRAIGTMRDTSFRRGVQLEHAAGVDDRDPLRVGVVGEAERLLEPLVEPESLAVVAR